MGDSRPFLFTTSKGIGFASLRVNIIFIDGTHTKHFQRLEFRRLKRLFDISWCEQIIRTWSTGWSQVPTLQCHIRTHTQRASNGRTDGCFREFSLLPLDVNHKTTTSSQSAHLALLPIVRKSRQQLHGTIMTLHQHLADTCRASEVTINLERRMRIEEVRIGSSLRIILRYLIARQ